MRTAARTIHLHGCGIAVNLFTTSGVLLPTTQRPGEATAHGECYEACLKETPSDFVNCDYVKAKVKTRSLASQRWPSTVSVIRRPIAGQHVIPRAVAQIDDVVIHR